MSWVESEGVAEIQSREWSLQVPITQWGRPSRISTSDQKSVWKPTLIVSTTPDFQPRAFDHYIRGNDLVIGYDLQADVPFSLQLDYRLVDYGLGDDDLTVELWLSVQTHLLSSYPNVHVGIDADVQSSLGWQGPSEPDREEWDWTASANWESLVANSSRSEPLSICGLSSECQLDGSWLRSSIMVHPLDRDECQWRFRQGSGLPMQIDLFNRFMEKGVIRRARLLYWVSRHQMTAERMRAVYRNFSCSPLPLTT